MLHGDINTDLVVFHCEIEILAMVCDVQSTGMMRGIVCEATVQLVSRDIELCEISVLGSRERTISKGGRKDTHVLFVDCYYRIVS
jgi:hypothetical protein